MYFRLKTRNGKDKFYSIQILGYNIVALFLGSTIRGKLRLNRKSRIKVRQYFYSKTKKIITYG